MEKPLPVMQMFTKVITSIFRCGHPAWARANCRQAGDSDETSLSRGLSGNRILPVMFLLATLSACGDNSNAPDANSRSASATAPQISVSAQPSAATQDTSTGLPPPPWTASAPQPSSDALLPPVIHTVD
jgi:hypothetical protein